MCPARSPCMAASRMWQFSDCKMWPRTRNGKGMSTLPTLAKSIEHAVHICYDPDKLTAVSKLLLGFSWQCGQRLCHCSSHTSFALVNLGPSRAAALHRDTPGLNTSSPVSSQVSDVSASLRAQLRLRLTSVEPYLYRARSCFAKAFAQNWTYQVRHWAGGTDLKRGQATSSRVVGRHVDLGVVRARGLHPLPRRFASVFPTALLRVGLVCSSSALLVA